MKRMALVPAAIILILSVVLTACGQDGKKNKYGTVIEDKEGHTHVVMTDDSGQTVVDKKGNLVEIIIGNDGKPITLKDGQTETSAVTYPALVVSKDKVELEGIEMYVPKGWKSESTVYISLTHKKNSKSQATLSVKKTDAYEDFESAVKAQTGLAESNTDEKLDIKVDELKLAGTVMYRRTLFNSESNSYMIRYLFENDGKIYVADCTVNGEYYETVGFDAIMDSIVLK